jgi:hypothetical protein
MTTPTVAESPISFDWKRHPEAQALVESLLAIALDGNPFIAALARRMRDETSTRFADWVDHLVVTDRPGLNVRVLDADFARVGERYGPGATVYEHEGGMFPRIVVVSGAGPEVREVAIKVESVAAFSRAHDLGLEPVGYPMGPYRFGRVEGGATSLLVVERRGYRGFEPFPGDLARAGRMAPQMTREALAARDLWFGRKRAFDDDALGFDVTDRLLDRIIERIGPDLACHVVFEGERAYWESRNHAARVQKARQDRLGLGWANHDHHTFRSSRRFFPRLIAIFERLGFALRERYHAGQHAGWGAQILEHPTTGVVIFADLDLAPDEAGHDFAHDPLPDLARPNTVGLWVGLHGESILQAGMHHLEAQFDFDALRDDLKAEAGIETMKPFSDFPFLRQAFTAGERWPVDRGRADTLLAAGWIDADQHARFLAEGAIGSHLENLQRSEGYKGFNQQSVSAILQATDPRKNGG